ncbi:MAG TPA: DUF378 domain-containing protein [Patescibacteria group bacterium]|nr:DUF378 domain-containing protein [Patescibacteria group bacterium]
MKWLHIVSYLLVWVGAVNWGLVGLSNYNLVESLLGTTGLVKYVYILVGLAGLYTIYGHLLSKECKICSGK